MKPNDLPWLGEYKVLGIPKTLKPYPDKPAHEILVEAAKKFGKNGFVQNGYKLTYKQMLELVEKLATALHNLGLKKGDRVATLLPTSIQFILADYAISRAGLVHIPSSSLEPADILRHKFQEGTPRALICLADYLNVVKPVVKGSSIEFLLVTHIDDFSKASPSHSADISWANGHWMSDLIARTSAAPPDYAFNVEKDLETLLFTGGTTGLPKGCMLTHRNIYGNALQNLYAMGQNGLLLRGAVSVLLALPFFHSYGHMIMHTMTLFGYNQLLVTDPRDTDNMIGMIKKYRPLIQIGVPTQFMKLCEHDLKGIGMLGLSGSAPLPPSAQDAYEKRSRGGIMEGYGLSEMSPVTHLNSTFLLRLFGGRVPVAVFSFILQIPGVRAVLNAFLRAIGPKAVGYALTRLFSALTIVTAYMKKFRGKKKGVEKRGTIGVPFPDTDIRIVDVGSGIPLTWDEVLAGQTGEMLIKGPQRMLGYWPSPGLGVDEDGYIHTSDVVRLDEKGYFYIVDRTKDMIIVSGFKVYSREVDDILFNHPDVEMAATVGVPDPNREGSELVVVFIQCRKECEGKLTEEDIIQYLRGRVAKYAVPKQVIMVSHIPLTEVQKINKKQLRALAIEGFNAVGLKKASNQ